MNKVLELDQLTKHFGRIKAVNKLSIEVEKGQVYGILGPNGSGKTTALSVIMGVIRQNSGSFCWFGKPGDNNGHKKNIGSLIEVPHFYPYMSLANNLKIVAHIKEAPHKDIDRVLKITRLYERRNSPYRTLSLGMKQRLALASVLLGDPEVMVLDEPTNGLDPEGIAEVRTIIQQEAGKGKTVILASHILAEVEKVCTHVAVLKNGELLASGKVDELLGTDRLFLVSAADIEKLEQAIAGAEMVRSFTRKEDELIISCTASVSSADLNRFAFDHGVTLSKLVSVKKSLESQFLELVR
jgi:ABC-type multidrug transport system ATPase subunit